MRRALPAALVLAIAGCGSSGMSAKDYRAKADAICASVRAQRDRLTPASNLEELKAVARSTIAINTDAVRRLQALKPPGDLKAPHSVIVTRLQETLKLQQQALTTDPASTAMRAINGRVAIAHAAIIKAAQDAKLPACAQL